MLNSWLKRGRKDVISLPEDLDVYLPASAQAPEAQRLNAYVPSDDDAGPDEDIQFLATLVDEIKRKPVEQKEPERKAAQRRYQPVQEDDPHAIPSAVQSDDRNLNIFRENADWTEKRELPPALQVDNIDIADLMETLSTTAAALRLRKAA